MYPIYHDFIFIPLVQAARWVWEIVIGEITMKIPRTYKTKIMIRWQMRKFLKSYKQAEAWKVHVRFTVEESTRPNVSRKHVVIQIAKRTVETIYYYILTKSFETYHIIRSSTI